MFAIVLALQQNIPVDIVTSSSVLAKRDAAEQSELFSLFGLTVGENSGPSSETKRIQYEKHIVYGDVGSFVGDILTHEFYERNIRGQRQFGVVILDEVDSMLIDEASHTTRLTDPLPGFEFLEPLLASIWQFLQIINVKIKFENGSLYWIEEDKVPELLQENATAEDEREFKISLLVDHAKGLIGDARLIIIPEHLKKFVYGQLRAWAESAISASLYRENVHYVVGESEEHKDIKIINYQNTGVVQERMHWSDGLHQFLQIKHGLQIKPEALSTIFMSNIHFFKRYNDQIYGMTGTLGASEERQLLQAIYGVDFLTVPTFMPKRFIEFPMIVAPANEWSTYVLSNILRETKAGRAVLVIAETINETYQIGELLRSVDFPAEKIRIYTRSDTFEINAVATKMDEGEVMLSTNLAGRGTNLKTTKGLEKKGGLHVFNHLPSS